MLNDVPFMEKFRHRLVFPPVPRGGRVGEDILFIPYELSAAELNTVPYLG
jgi:hypothetical protein